MYFTITQIPKEKASNVFLNQKFCNCNFNNNYKENSASVEIASEELEQLSK